MAATSPPLPNLSSPGCKHRLPLERAILARSFAPSSAIPLRFFIFGLLCLAGATGWLLIHPTMVLIPYHTPHTIAWAHLYILGFALSIVMGAAYQIVPVALGVQLHSERLARFHPILHIVGVALLVPMFFIWSLPMVTLGGTLLISGALLFTYNLTRTLGRISRFDPIAVSLAFSLGWLILTMALGLTMSIPALRMLLPHPSGDWLAAHAHLGIGGIFINLIVGISFRLLPLFTLSSLQSPVRAWLASLGLNAGLAVIFVAIGLGHFRCALAGGTIITVALAIALGEMFAICAARQRRNLDWGLRLFLVAVGLLMPLTGIGLVAALTDPGSPVRNFYALLALLGVVGLAMVGMLHKILPFLVWYSVYSPQIGKSEVPSLAAMVSVPLQKITFLACLGGFGLLEIGVALSLLSIATIGLWVWGVGIATWLVNAVSILNHLRKISPPPHPPSKEFLFS